MIPNERQLKSQIRRKFIERTIASFLDILVMTHFQNDSFSGYDAVQFIQARFGVLLSPGKVYSTIYAMERKMLVVGSSADGKRIYKITKIGKLTLDTVTASDEIEVLMANIMKE